MKRVLIIGACSAIAAATARKYAEQGAELFLAARNRQHLEVLAADLEVRGAKNVSLTHSGYDVTQQRHHTQSVDFKLPPRHRE